MEDEQSDVQRPAPKTAGPPEPGAEKKLDDCDLVMKGGIASGVVYPPAIVALAKKYRFRAIGGASAGAIAAAVAAAAEYGRDATSKGAGFRGLAARGTKLANGELINQLFEPSPGTARLFHLAKGLVEKAAGDLEGKEPGLMRWVLRVTGALAWRAPTGFWPGALAGGIAATAATRPWAVAPPVGWEGTTPVFLLWAFVIAIFAILVAVGALLGSALALVGGVTTLFSGNKSFFGFCTGHRAHEREPHRLTDWLHQGIQELAGLDERGRPLTIDDMSSDERIRERRSITFSMVTTNLSVAQPVVFPRKEGDLIFHEDDFRKLFPEAVVKYLLHPDEPRVTEEDDDWRRREKHRHAPRDLPKGFHYLPRGGSLPVIVATRLSLSFPLLLGAVRLYTVKGEVFAKRGKKNRAEPLDSGDLVEHWFSDGGIAANFPLSMFDSWIPDRPTFGINLIEGPVPSRLAKFARSGSVVRHPAKEASLSIPEPEPIKGIARFFMAMLDTARNARDNAQMSMASYRERVVHIYLARGEGGLNLGMDADMLKRIQAKGTQAAAAILGDGPGKPAFDFDEHRWVRLLLLLNHMEHELFAARDILAPGDDRYVRLHGMVDELFALRDKAQASKDTQFYKPHDPDWCREAKRRVHALVDLIETWDRVPATDPQIQGAGDTQQFQAAPAAGSTRLFQIDPPKPPGALRVTSRV